MNLNKLVSKFIGNECVVEQSIIFSYVSLNRTIGLIFYSLNEDNYSNAQWKKFLKKEFNFDLTNENLFSVSILHELGHHKTMCLFSSEEWENQVNEEYYNLDGEEREQAYFKKPIEYAATKYAIEFYRKNPVFMRKWNHRFNCAIRHYEKLRKVKTSILTKF